MADGPELQSIVKRLLAQAAALHEIVALLLAEHAEKTADPMGSLRDLSNRLSRKLADEKQMGVKLDPQLLSDIESEFDHIIASARDILS